MFPCISSASSFQPPTELEFVQLEFSPSNRSESSAEQNSAGIKTFKKLLQSKQIFARVRVRDNATRMNLRDFLRPLLHTRTTRSR